jgi:hypothetical protein
MAAQKRTVVMGERKTASRCRLRTGETSRGSRERRPLLSKEVAESNREVTSNLPWTATLEAKRAGWERGWTSDHLEPFLWVLADSEYHVLPAGSSSLRRGWKEAEQV